MTSDEWDNLSKEERIEILKKRVETVSKIHLDNSPYKDSTNISMTIEVLGKRYTGEDFPFEIEVSRPENVETYTFIYYGKRISYEFNEDTHEFMLKD